MTRKDELLYIIPSLSKDLGEALLKIKCQNIDDDFWHLNLVSDTIDEIRQYLLEYAKIEEPAFK